METWAKADSAQRSIATSSVEAMSLFMMLSSLYTAHFHLLLKDHIPGEKV
jgi:hypothetical protein